jgi:hypothetical protein
MIGTTTHDIRGLHQYEIFSLIILHLLFFVNISLNSGFFIPYL